jgi:hypothetical protein
MGIRAWFHKADNVVEYRNLALPEMDIPLWSHEVADIAEVFRSQVPQDMGIRASFRMAVDNDV